jgi:hypothetical protein
MSATLLEITWEICLVEGGWKTPMAKYQAVSVYIPFPNLGGYVLRLFH